MQMDLRLISSGSVASFHPIPPSHHHHHHAQIESYHHHHNGSFGDPYHPHQQQIYHHQSADPYGHHGSSLAVYTGHNNHQWSSPMDDNHHHHPTFPPPPPPPSNHHHHLHPHLLPISSPLSSSSSSSSLTSTPPSTYCLPFSPRSSNSSNISANSPGLISSPPSSISTSSQSDQQTAPTIKPTIFTATTIDYYEPSSESPINQINPNSPSPSQSQQHHHQQQQQHPLPPTPPPSSSITTITQLNSLHNLPTIIQSTESINNNLTENENQSITLIETPMVDHTLTMNLNHPPTPTHHQLHHSNPHEHYHFNQGNELTEQSDGTIRFPRKRNTANKKERKRTVSINTAFSLLRDHIPNVPIDTKLSKIKTLRLATDYISYLMTLLETSNSPDSYDKHGNPTRSFKCEDFKVDLQRFKGARSETDLRVNSSLKDRSSSVSSLISSQTVDYDLINMKKAKGRTGWPQHVWALELKQQQST